LSHKFEVEKKRSASCSMQMTIQVCKKKWCHVVLWNFRLHFEPSCLPPLTKEVPIAKVANKAHHHSGVHYIGYMV
jgi:DNA-binding HxlR family transcriptional regulator